MYGPSKGLLNIPVTPAMAYELLSVLTNTLPCSLGFHVEFPCFLLVFLLRAPCLFSNKPLKLSAVFQVSPLLSLTLVVICELDYSCLFQTIIQLVYIKWRLPGCCLANILREKLILPTFGILSDNKSCKTLKFLSYIFNWIALRVTSGGISNPNIMVMHCPLPQY